MHTPWKYLQSEMKCTFIIQPTLGHTIYVNSPKVECSLLIMDAALISLPICWIKYLDKGHLRKKRFILTLS